MTTIHVPSHNASEKLKISVPVDTRHVLRIEGNTFVMKSGSRIKTAYGEKDLRLLLERAERRAV